MESRFTEAFQVAVAFKDKGGSLICAELIKLISMSLDSPEACAEA